MEAFLLSEENPSGFAPLRTILQPHKAIDSKVDPDWSKAPAIPPGPDDHMCRARYTGDLEKVLPGTAKFLDDLLATVNSGKARNGEPLVAPWWK